MFVPNRWLRQAVFTENSAVSGPILLPLMLKTSVKIAWHDPQKLSISLTSTLMVISLLLSIIFFQVFISARTPTPLINFNVFMSLTIGICSLPKLIVAKGLLQHLNISLPAIPLPTQSFKVTL